MGGRGLWATSLALALTALTCGEVARREVAVRGVTMGTTYSVKYVGPASRGAVAAAIEDELAAVNAVFSTYDPDSEISRFNAHESLEPFAASAPFAALVREALLLAEQTEGAFDPTVMPLVELYGFGPGADRHVPAGDEIKAALARVGHDKIEVDADGCVVKSVARVTIDLSAMAKGLGVDRVSERIRKLGATGSMVEIGGEVRCHGHKADGRPWRIGIERPNVATGELDVDPIEPGEDGLATSGDYRIAFEQDGARVHHIIDPRTGHNAETPVFSVSVRASTCARADALATALMVLGPDGSEEVFRRVGDPALRVRFLIHGEDGAVETRGVRW